MILVDRDIRDRLAAGLIKLDPFDESQLNPNSYNVRLHPVLKTYAGNEQSGWYTSHRDWPIIDARTPHEMLDVTIPAEGLVLVPGQLYLGRTIEYTETHGPLVPMLEGRSSTARLGISVHIAAGFGDSGFCGTWTLELSVVQPVRIYPDMQIAQLFWVAATGTPEQAYHSEKYQGQIDATPSRLFLESPPPAVHSQG